MKAIRLVEIGKPLVMQEIPVPEPGDRDVLVRVRAAGICHSDVHYRAGVSPAYPLPLTLGHEVAGVVEFAGRGVKRLRPGDRVVLNYNVTCGDCYYCNSGHEQFCSSGKMIGHFTDGGYAYYIALPERGTLILPEEISFEQGATLMCASATALHALRKSRLQGGETLAVFGAGGLGMSAIQLGRVFGARDIYAVDINPIKLAMAASFGAIPINAQEGDPVRHLRDLTSGHGVEVAIEFIGLPQTMRQALLSLSPLGRAVIVGISGKPFEIDSYRELLGPEAELIGSNDHLLQELPLLIELARRGVLDLSKVVTRTVPLEAAAVNAALDDLERFGDAIRTVIVP